MSTDSASAPHPAAGLSSKAVTNLFIDWGKEAQCSDLTPLKVQKLLFFCHAALLLRSNIPLIRDEFEAWSYGPVIPSIYHALKQFGSGLVTSYCQEFDPFTGTVSIPRATLNIQIHGAVRDTFDIYVMVTGGQLSSLSHARDGPWEQALKAFNAGKNINRKISNTLIRDFCEKTS